MQQTRDSYFAPHLFPHFPLSPPLASSNMARTAARWAVALVALLATTAAFVVRPVRCAQPVENHGRLSFGGFFTCKSLIANSLLSHALWIHTRPSVERRRVLPRKILSSSSGRTVSGSKLTLHAGKNMGRRSLLQQVCQISASLPDVESVWSI
jgi:hypothetical protein